MKPSIKTKSIFETLLVFGLILIIPLFFAINSGANTPETQAEISPIPPTVAVNAPEDSNAVKPKQPPACTFPLANITVPEATPEDYTFSEPTVVLSHPDNTYDIVGWLPDNQQVLMAQDLNDARKNGDLLQQSLELYNPESGETKVYAIRYHITEPPSWQPELKAVIYPAMNFLGFEKNENKLKYTHQVWVSYGDPNSTQILADNLLQFSLAVNPESGETIYLKGNQMLKKNGILKDSSPVTFNSTQWDYAEGRKSEIPVSYRMVWQPNTEFVFLYGDGVFRFDGYTYLLNTNTGETCELDLGGWATKARWSSDGRYLAIIRTRDHFPIKSSDLAILDTITGKLYAVDVNLEKVNGNHFVDDFAWASDNHHLLAIGKFSQTNQSEGTQSGLYLVDFVVGESVSVLPTYTFYAASSKGNLAWSPDGTKVIIRCPTAQDEKICLITVKQSED